MPKGIFIVIVSRHHTTLPKASPAGSNRYYVAKCDIVFFTLDKSTDSELQNGTSYTTVEKQWESHFALKDETCKLTFEKMAFEVLVLLMVSPSLSTPIQQRSHPLKI